MFRLTPLDNLTCARCRARLNEYVDSLPSASVRAHLDTCADCAALARDFATLRADLRALPRPQVSAGFEVALLARLSQSPARTFRTATRAVLRPALALTACAAALGTVLFVHPASVTPALPAPSAAAPADLSLVGHCVAQHGADADAQPLADPSARVLSDRLADAATNAGSLDGGL